MIYHDEFYSYAIVTSCSRLTNSNVWILARTPFIQPEVFEELVGRAEKAGFDLSDLEPTIQTGCWD